MLLSVFLRMAGEVGSSSPHVRYASASTSTIAQFSACACVVAEVAMRKKQQKSEKGLPSVLVMCVLKYHHSVADEPCARSCAARSIAP